MNSNEGLSNNKKLRGCSITKITIETPNIKTLWFKDNMVVTGGQFVMVWLPGNNEIPMSVSYTAGKEKGLTIAKVGPTTTKLHELSVGSKLGIRGPYGNGYDISKAHRILVVAGGCGSAPLGPVLDDAATVGKELTFVLGARTKDELLFKERVLDLGIELDISTDDGSEGYHGFVTARMEQILSNNQYDLIISCGPEVMLKKVIDIAKKYKTPVQASLERYMKCGIGICDSCSINGYQVCRDGPVFDGEVLSKLDEFGKSRRDACGRVITI